MLTYLHVEHFTIIDTLSVEFYEGMTVITGETGAGKSIIFDALDLALGKKAPASCVRPGHAQCTITAQFDISDLPAAKRWFETHTIDAEDETCVIQRVISDKGRSRITVNGAPISLNILKDLAQALITILGQHDAHHLLHSEQHKMRLDKYAKHDDLLHRVKTTYEAWHDAQAKLNQLIQQKHTLDKEQALLRYQLDEWEQHAFTEAEFVALENELNIRSQASDLAYFCEKWLSGLNDDDAGTLNHLHMMDKEMAQAAHIDPKFNVMHELLTSCIAQCDELVSDIKHYQDHIDMDAQALQTVTQRISDIHSLARKYNFPEIELPAHFEQLNEQLNRIDTIDEDIAALQLTVKTSLNAYVTQAQALSTSRIKAAKKLSKAVTSQIQPLGMPKGIFEVAVTPLDPEHGTALGIDEVEFLVQTNPGQSLQPMADVVSGGELSRINLAIHVNITPATARPTMLFDEVDVGISGKTAYLVGQLLRSLAQTGQIICVTHLPQVASMGHHHLQVEKVMTKKHTQVTIQCLSETLRIEEIARMLGGQTITDQTRSHAKELMAEVG